MHPFIWAFLSILVGEAVLVFLLNLIPRLGWLGKDMAVILTKAPGLDVIVSLFLWVPWVIGGIIYGWLGLGAAIAAQYK